jgi:DinB superfamily
MGELDDSDRRARALAAQLTVEQLNWQAAPSIGQCLEDLCKANETYLPAIAVALQGKSSTTVSEITPGRFARWFIRSIIEPSPQTKRAPAPKKIVPGAHVEASVLDRFLTGNQTARDLIHRAAAYDVNRIRFKNPYIRGLRFTVGTGLVLVCSHERRHLLQAERVKNLQVFPKSGK